MCWRVARAGGRLTGAGKGGCGVCAWVWWAAGRRGGMPSLSVPDHLPLYTHLIPLTNICAPGEQQGAPSQTNHHHHHPDLLGVAVGTQKLNK